MRGSQPTLDAEVRSAYLDRLGLEAERPSVVALRRLHQRQVERVPYETLWIAAGEEWGIDPFDAATRIALHGRGGYCYHLNGALAELLRSLGYAVRTHVGGVHGSAGPDAESVGNHMVLTVRGLPTDENPGGVWYVDAGLGDAMHEPLPLVSGYYEQPPFQLSLERVPQPEGDGWHLTHDPSGGFTGMSWTDAEASPGAFTAMHRTLSTSPESGFVRVAMAARRDATGVDVMRGLVLTRIGSDARTGEPLTNRTDWFETLAEVFGLRFSSLAPGQLDRLWAQVLARHDEWEAAGRSQN